MENHYSTKVTAGNASIRFAYIPETENRNQVYNIGVDGNNAVRTVFSIEDIEKLKGGLVRSWGVNPDEFDHYLALFKKRLMIQKERDKKNSNG